MHEVGKQMFESSFCTGEGKVSICGDAPYAEDEQRGMGEGATAAGEGGGIKIVTLDCGVKVVMEKIDHVQSASFGVWSKTGSVNEEDEISGVSHFIEHMMFKGTESRSAKDIATDIDRIGGQINAFTGKEATCYYVKTLGSSLEAGADVILDMVTGSVFDTVEIDKERKVILEEIKMIQDQPDEMAMDTIAEVVLKGSPFGRAIIGTPETLSKIDRKVILNYLRREYTRSSMVVSVAGNFDEERIIEFLQSKFDKLEAAKPALVIPKCKYEVGFLSMDKDIQQTHLCLGTMGVDVRDPEFFALNILNNVMGGSMSSRLFQNIREDKGLAYSVYSFNNTNSSEGMFSIYAGIAHDKISEALAGIRAELEILDAGGITEDEFNMSKEQIKSSYIFSQENVASRMFANGKNMMLLGRPIAPEEILEKYNRVTMEDIEKTKKKISRPENYSIVAVTKGEPDLKKLWM